MNDQTNCPEYQRGQCSSNRFDQVATLGATLQVSRRSGCAKISSLPFQNICRAESKFLTTGVNSGKQSLGCIPFQSMKFFNVIYQMDDDKSIVGVSGSRNMIRHSRAGAHCYKDLGCLLVYCNLIDWLNYHR